MFRVWGLGLECDLVLAFRGQPLSFMVLRFRRLAAQ